MSRFTFNLTLFLGGYFFGFWLAEEARQRLNLPDAKAEKEKARDPNPASDGPWLITVDLEHLSKIIQGG